MNYRGYEVYEKDGAVVVGKVRDFNPVHVFECGQCFRWLAREDGTYTGVALGRAVNVGYSDGRLIIRNSTLQDFQSVWFDYFDLGRDYSRIKELVAKDEIMMKAVAFGWGIRLLRQDFRETLISFILSTNKRIPMIMKVVAAISGAYGEELELDGESHYTFPGLEKLSAASVEELKVCRGGYRCKYIVETSRMVKNGEASLQGLGSVTAEEARQALILLPGVGNKVADCTLLYSGTRYDVFPTDVWVKRVMEELYFKREASLKEIQQFSAGYFGELAGFAQQYLFYYARENKIGVG